MDQDNTFSQSSSTHPLGGKSWTAYVGIGFVAFIMLLIATQITLSGLWQIGLTILVLLAIFVVYRVLVIRSYQLYFNDVGIWVHSGILPWSKGVSGVKWRDLDEAVYTQSLGSWLFKSYSIRIGHRFTKSNEIFLSHMARGHESVMAINSKHQELIRADALK